MNSNGYVHGCIYTCTHISVHACVYSCARGRDTPRARRVNPNHMYIYILFFPFMSHCVFW